MDSFSRLGLSASVAEALLAVGVEVPTALQEMAVPVIRRGTSCVLRASPGAGLLVTWGAPLLDRVEPGGGRPGAIVLTADPERTRGLALSLARIGSATGHRIGALGIPWVRPAGSDILFSTPEGLERGVRSAAVKTDAVRSIVVDGASAVLAARERADRLVALLPHLGPGHPQVVLLSDPVTEPVRRWVDAHLRRAVFLPAAPAPPAPGTRGALRVVTLEEEVERVLPGIVERSLSGGSDHVLLFARSHERARDLGDLLVFCGATVGSPGDRERDVWLGVDPLEARASLGSPAAGELAVVSADVPADVDDLERRHRSPGPADAVLSRSRELPHLRRMAAEAGYTLTVVPAPPPFEKAESDFRSRLEGVIEREDLAPYLALLEPLVRSYSAVEVAAALAALLRKAERAGGGGAQRTVPDGEAAAPAGRRPPAWTKLFLSVGKRDGVQAGDVLGAVTGEAGVAGGEVGRIEIRDAYTRIEVHDPVAGKVIRALNGSSIRGRSVRADYDRERGRGTDAAVPRRRRVRSPKSGG